ncbi:MAG: hypothetical protein CVT94_15160 [Bacteroidetes bacterium HGW-Bacteroidetes-11]|jgi:hypothetical protein|nr:MAG: hypothetical protein CVT94_15160 [Bacteroidetes bacterium HGW-Bacteroidetes-11]
MKNSLKSIFCLLIILFSISCEKENRNDTPEPDILSGTWRFSSGGGSSTPINNNLAPVFVVMIAAVNDSSILIEFKNNHEYFFIYQDSITESGEYEIINNNLVYFSPKPSKFLNFCFGNINYTYVPDTSLQNTFNWYDHNFSLDTLTFKITESSELEIQTFKIYERPVTLLPDFTEIDTVAYISEFKRSFIKL